MKIILRNLSLLAMALATYSCNEKISPQLQNGNSTTVGGVNNQQPDEFYLRITNQSPVVLNYVLHRTGNGNKKADCEVKSSNELSSQLFRDHASDPYDTKAYDISCFFEAEELSLHFNGLDFQVEASKNTCEYISYQPYSYYNGIPGRTKARWLGITCDGGAPTSAQLIDLGATWLNATTPIGCGQMVDLGTPIEKRIPVTITDEYKNLCAFDYSENTEGLKQNCDTGYMSFTILSYGATETTVANDTYKCGGKTAACVEGAIRNISEFDNKAFGEVLTEAVINKDFKLPYKLAPLDGKRFGNVDIVNYRRGLASLDLNFGDYTPGSESNSNLALPSWKNMNQLKSFDPNLMEAYSINKYPEISTRKVISDTELEAQKWKGGWEKLPFAADPFLSTRPDLSRVSPFYTVLCLDQNKDIKARIRMVVRDWDRSFPSDSIELEYISDVYKDEAERRQDKPTLSLEVPGDPATSYWNDYDDWDNLVWLERSSNGVGGIYSSGNTTWKAMTAPVEDSSGAITTNSANAWPLGNWSPYIFPWVDRKATE